MQDPNEIAKINEFLSLAAPFVISRVKRLFESLGLDVKEQGTGNNLAFVIKSDKVKVMFLPYNMMLDIATIDRRATPLEFDEDVWQLDFFLAKTAHVVESKLRVVFDALAADDPDTAIERLYQGTRSDEWFRAWKFDPKGQNVSRGQQRLSVIGEFDSNVVHIGWPLKLTNKMKQDKNGSKGEGKTRKLKFDMPNIYQIFSVLK